MCLFCLCGHFQYGVVACLRASETNSCRLATFIGCLKLYEYWEFLQRRRCCGAIAKNDLKSFQFSLPAWLPFSVCLCVCVRTFPRAELCSIFQFAPHQIIMLHSLPASTQQQQQQRIQLSSIASPKTHPPLLPLFPPAACCLCSPITINGNFASVK